MKVHPGIGAKHQELELGHRLMLTLMIGFMIGNVDPLSVLFNEESKVFRIQEHHIMVPNNVL